MESLFVKHPKPIRIIMLNLVYPEKSDIIPGYQLLQDFFAKARHKTIKASKLRGSKQEIEMLSTIFNTLAINYLGASTYYASILGMDSQSPQYMKWVKDSLTYIILPKIKPLHDGTTP
jgi:hypothetical protein